MIDVLVSAAGRAAACPPPCGPASRAVRGAVEIRGRGGRRVAKRSSSRVCRRCRWSDTSRKSGEACARRGLWTRRAAGAASGRRAPRDGSAEHTPDRGAARYPSIARGAPPTQRPADAGMTLLAADEGTGHRRIARHRSVRSQQKPALGSPSRVGMRRHS